MIKIKWQDENDVYFCKGDIDMYADASIKVGFAQILPDEDSVTGKGAALPSGCLRNSEDPDLILYQYSASLQAFELICC